MINKKKECDIISDLLPLYLEEKTSAESGEFIKEHVEHCQECRRNLKRMSASYEEIFDKSGKTGITKDGKRFSKNKIFGRVKGKIFVYGYLFFLFCWWIYLISCYI